MQRTMLELLNQLDGFSSTTDIKVSFVIFLQHLALGMYEFSVRVWRFIVTKVFRNYSVVACVSSEGFSLFISN